MVNFFTAKDLTERYQISRGTLFNLMNAGKFPQAVKFGRTFRWKKSDIEDFESAGGI